MNIGDKVLVTKELNCYWAGVGTVVDLFTFRKNTFASVSMESGEAIRQKGAFLASKLKVVNQAPQPLEIVGGAPHGFGVWIEGKYYPVDIGALGKVIIDLQSEARRAESTPLFDRFEDWFNSWDTTKSPEIRRLCRIAWELGRARRKVS
jgi:hypothetical protein